MFADLVKLGYGVDDVVAHIVGVGSEKADALNAAHIVDGGEQVGEVNAAGQVVAVGVHVLA